MPLDPSYTSTKTALAQSLLPSTAQLLAHCNIWGEWKLLVYIRNAALAANFDFITYNRLGTGLERWKEADGMRGLELSFAVTRAVTISRSTNAYNHDVGLENKFLCNVLQNWNVEAFMRLVPSIYLVIIEFCFCRISEEFCGSRRVLSTSSTTPSLISTRNSSYHTKAEFNNC